MLSNIGYPSETHPNHNSREISFIHDFFIAYSIVLCFFAEHGSDTAMLYAKFQTDWTIETEAMDERDAARFEFNMSFRRKSYVA